MAGNVTRIGRLTMLCVYAQISGVVKASCWDRRCHSTHLMPLCFSCLQSFFSSCQYSSVYALASPAMGHWGTCPPSTSS